MPMTEALRLAGASQGGPFGAVVVKSGIIIGRGTNRVIPDNDPTAHAEILAIRAACDWLDNHSLEGCNLYTSCFPCPMCLAACLWANISLVYYAAPAVGAAAVGFRDLETNFPRCICMQEHREAAEDFLKHWGGTLY